MKYILQYIHIHCFYGYLISYWEEKARTDITWDRNEKARKFFGNFCRKMRRMITSDLCLESPFSYPRHSSPLGSQHSSKLLEAILVIRRL